MIARCTTLVALVFISAWGVPAHAAIFGSDDRVEALDAEAPLRNLAKESTIALIHRDSAEWSLCADAGLEFDGDTVGESNSLCSGEAFAEQPAMASCSATLIDDDLIITAKHCLPTDDPCAGSLFLLGLHYDADGNLPDFGYDDLYACRRVVVESEEQDLAIVQLDRPVGAPFAPAPVAEDEVVVGASLGQNGFPLGSPMKVSPDCEALEVMTGTGNQFKHNCDSFRGSSGSGIYSDAGELVGVHVSGPGDYRPRDGADCKEAVIFDETGELPGVTTIPQLGVADSVLPIIQALCETEWPTALCGGAPDCGDGLCNGDETDSNCESDCGERSSDLVCPDDATTNGHSGGCASSGANWVLVALAVLFASLVSRKRLRFATSLS